MYCCVFRTYPHRVQFGKLWVVGPLAIGWLTIPHTWLYHHGQHQQCHLQKSFVFWTIKRVHWRKRNWAETMSCNELTCIKTEFGAPDMWNKACVLCQEGNIFRTQEITRNACRELSLRSMWHSLCTVSSMSPSCVYIPSTSSNPPHLPLSHYLANSCRG